MSAPPLIRRLVEAAAARRHLARSQSGFAILAGLMVWMMLGGVLMVALLNMTMAANTQAINDATRAQQLRAVDAALETTVAAIQVDPSGRVGLPTGKGGCEEQVGTPDGLFYDDAEGNTVQVTASCYGSGDKQAERTVSLTARVVEPTTSRLLVGSAQLSVTPLRGPGNEVTVLNWSLTAPPDDTDLDTPPSTTTTTTIAPTTTTTTPTTTSVVPSGVSWTSRVTAEWQSGYCVEVTVTNKGKSTQKWAVQVPVKGKIYTSWSAKYQRTGDVLDAVGEQWNQSLRSGESTQFGWCSNF